nr:hypothetical protein [Candidatus Gastranaerophilales bacterium]
DEQKFNLFMQYLREINENIKIKYPKAKFVFIIYNKSQCSDLFTDDRIRQIKDLGIDFISLEDIFGDKLYSKEFCINETDAHPSYYAWNQIVPELVKAEKM